MRAESIAESLEEVVQRVPGRIAVSAKDTSLTYAQLWAAVVQQAQRFDAVIGGPEQRCLLLLENTCEGVVAFLALASKGVPTILLGSDSKNSEILAVLDSIPSDAIVGSPAKLILLSGAVGGQRKPLVSTRAPEMSGPTARRSVRFAAPAPREFLFQFTSGSTGLPKAAIHSQADLLFWARTYQSLYNIRPTDSILAPIPLHHSFGLGGALLGSLMSGARLVIHERFAPRQVLETLEREGIDILFGTPFMYDLILRSSAGRSEAVASLRACISSGGPLAPELADRFRERFNAEIHQVYGSTEAGILATWGVGQQCSRGSVGYPIPGVEIRVTDEKGADVRPGEVGSIRAFTPGLFSGYFGDSVATSGAIVNGWYVSGDTGHRDEYGCLFISGRKDTFINLGGRKVNPEEVQATLLSHPSVREALVYGSEAGTAGWEVQAAVVTNGTPVTAKELMVFCRERLAPYKVPTHIELVLQLPRSGMGKVVRTGLQVRNETDRER